MSTETLREAAEAIVKADALLIAAGAGMGVDSGLPDFRGDHGFWKAYPPYEKLGLSFIQLANPEWFEKDPELAWGFYGHRLELYRKTQPHAGFGILLKWARTKKMGAYVFTSNVDGQFQYAGFDPDHVVEAHGSIHWMQCTQTCGKELFSADPFHVRIDEATFRAQTPLPECPSCHSLARPNILMFGDGEWERERSAQQAHRLNTWLRQLQRHQLVIIECGAGTAVPTVRFFSEQMLHQKSARLIRINPREWQGPPGTLSFQSGALETLKAIDLHMH